jgi:cytochrome c biogenesis protein CcmG/thiol:disulfide interchange protein DsbE
MVQEPNFLQEKTKTESGEPNPFFSVWTITLIIGMAILVGVLAIQLFQQNQTQPLPGTTAPQFDLEAYDGTVYDLSELGGKIVVVNLWASWCVPCHAEAPALEQIHLEYADKEVLMLGVNWLDIENEAMNFINRYHITYPNAPDVGEKFHQAYNIQGPPETFVIDQNGTIAATFIGMLTYDQLAEALDELIARGDA